MAQPILTFTGNPLAETTFECLDWHPGGTFRARSSSFQVGGKGINVSKMLTRLRAPNTALCFPGGAPGAECEAWLRAKGFALKAFPSEAPTRCGTVVRGSGQAETTFLGPDAPATAGAVRACAEYLDALPDGQVLAICGSIPGWTGSEWQPLREALGRWLQRGALTVDTYGPPLAWLAAQPLALIKINAVELRTLGYGGADAGAVLAAVDRHSPVRCWVVSDGPGTVWLRDETGAVTSVTPPRVQEVSATGAGDVLHASLLDSLFRQGLTLGEAVARALPLASANAAHAGIAEFPYVDGAEPPRD